MSNNAVNLAVIAKTNIASIKKTKDRWYCFTYASEHFNSPAESSELSGYSNLIHNFGVDKFKKLIQYEQEKKYFKPEEYGRIGTEMLHASLVYNRDMSNYFRFHALSDKANFNQGTKDPFQAVAEMNLKPVHLVTNIYAVGAVVDGEDFITARPYTIMPFKQYIDFVKGKVQREKTEWFGDFEYHSCIFEKGRETAWEEQDEKGVFLYTPKENPIDVEEVRVNYLDKTTNEIHTIICQFSTFYSDNVARLTRYEYGPDVNDDIFDAYRYDARSSTHKDIINTVTLTDQMYSPSYTHNKMFITIVEGSIMPPETANYVFSITTHLSALFDLSEEPLHGDPDLDSKYLLNHQKKHNYGFASANHSKELKLDAGKIYNFRYIVFPDPKDLMAQGWVGFSKNGEEFKNLPGTWFKLTNMTDEFKFEHQFKPNFERIYLMDKFDGFIRNDQSKWSLLSSPNGEVVKTIFNSQGTGGSVSKIQAMTGDETYCFRVNWWNYAVAFPHIFEFDMGETNTFDTIHLKGEPNDVWFGLENYIKIYLAPCNYKISNPPEYYTSDNYSIYHEESLIWEGFYNTAEREYIEFNKNLSGRYIRLVSINNSKKWKDGNPGKTSFSIIEVGHKLKNEKIYPMTNKRYITKTNRWDEYYCGAYYNGKGYTGYASGAAPPKENDNSNSQNSIMTIRVPKLKPEIGIIGDYYPGMGTAIVKIDGKEVGRIHESFDKYGDERRLKSASRSHMSVLFYYTKLDTSKNHILTIEVIEGQITLAGILAHQMIVNYHTDDFRYQKILQTEFNDVPEQFDWNIPSDELGPYVPTPMATSTPIPIATPIPIKSQSLPAFHPSADLQSLEPSLSQDPSPNIDINLRDKEKKKGLSGGAIAGIVIAVVVVPAAGFIGGYIFFNRYYPVANSDHSVMETVQDDDKNTVDNDLSSEGL